MPRLAAHGTDSGYRKHLRLGQRPCLRCYDAHRLANAQRRLAARTEPKPPGAGFLNADDPMAYLAVRRGLEPAESLTTEDRERLVAELHGLGWSDVQIAELTWMSTYTTARIRARLGLTANHPTARSHAA